MMSCRRPASFPLLGAVGADTDREDEVCISLSHLAASTNKCQLSRLINVLDSPRTEELRTKATDPGNSSAPQRRMLRSSATGEDVTVLTGFRNQRRSHACASSKQVSLLLLQEEAKKQIAFVRMRE